MRIFSFSEVYGPFKCESPTESAEAPHCGQYACDFALTSEENKTMPKQIGPEAAGYVLRSGMGIMLCGDCLNIRVAKEIATD